jgi:WD40 repeat protein
MDQDSIGLLCDDFDHIKNKHDGAEIDDLGKIRSVKISPHNSLNQIACGDSCGYIWTFDSVSMKLINIHEVHQNEILDLDFAPYDDIDTKRSLLLATASKDHTVKLFDPKNDYEELRHIEDHTSAVVGIRFVQDPSD